MLTGNHRKLRGRKNITSPEIYPHSITKEQKRYKIIADFFKNAQGIFSCI
jgi:hypothetical protein